MVMFPFAFVSDLEARWRPLSDEEKVSAGVLIEDASQIILDEVPAAADAPEMTLRRVVCAMVKRAMASPVDFGVTSVQQGAGPYQQTTQFANPTGDLYLTKAERRVLGGSKQRAFSIDLIGGADAG